MNPWTIYSHLVTIPATVILILGFAVLIHWALRQRKEDRGALFFEDEDDK